MELPLWTGTTPKESSWLLAVSLWWPLANYNSIIIKLARMTLFIMHLTPWHFQDIQKGQGNEQYSSPIPNSNRYEYSIKPTPTPLPMLPDQIKEWSWTSLRLSADGTSLTHFRLWLPLPSFKRSVQSHILYCYPPHLLHSSPGLEASGPNLKNQYGEAHVYLLLSTHTPSPCKI